MAEINLSQGAGHSSPSFHLLSWAAPFGLGPGGFFPFLVKIERKLKRSVNWMKLGSVSRLHPNEHLGDIIKQMSKQPSAAKKAMEMASELGLLRAQEALAAGIPSMVLTRLVEAGELIRVSRGLYRLAGTAESEYADLIEVAKRTPSAVIVLLSALAFHEIGTQLPACVWILLPHGTHTPRTGWPKLKVVRSRLEPAFHQGVEQYQLGETKRCQGVPILVTTPARTVADCFKYRRQVGMDVCLEALRSVLRERRATVQELLRFARMNRVESTLRPALEAML
jgi:predicted transcriptional regulator of viral defense system